MKTIKIMRFCCGVVFSAAIGTMLAAMFTLAGMLLLGSSGGEVCGGALLLGFVAAGAACTVDMLVDALGEDLKEEIYTEGKKR